MKLEEIKTRINSKIQKKSDTKSNKSRQEGSDKQTVTKNFKIDDKDQNVSKNSSFRSKAKISTPVSNSKGDKGTGESKGRKLNSNFSSIRYFLRPIPPTQTTEKSKGTTNFEDLCQQRDTKGRGEALGETAEYLSNQLELTSPDSNTTEFSSPEE